MFEYFCGIDIAKDSFSVAIIDNRNNIYKTYSAQMNKENFEKLLHILNPIGKKVIIGMESSGSYHINLFSFLTSKGYTVVIINPLIISNFAKIQLRKCKTDKKDALVIAKALTTQEFNQIHINQNLRELAREREFLTYQIAKIKNEIKRLIHILFPEVEYKCWIFSSSILNVFAHYPSANAIANAKPDRIKKLMKRKIKISPKELVELAKNSIGINNKALEVIISYKISMLMQMKEQLKKITKMLIEEAQEVAEKEINILISIDGIDKVLASHFIAEIGSISNFSSYKKLIAYAGVDPSVYQSGKFEGKRKISKRGNRHLRRILWLMAVNVVFRSEYFRSYFMKKMTADKSYKMAMMCVIHKLVRVIYSMLSYGTHFYYSQEVLCHNFS